MSKIDRSKFADKALAIVVGKGKPPTDSKDKEDESEDESKPGKLGRVLAAALNNNDYEAIEEAVCQIADRD